MMPKPAAINPSASRKVSWQAGSVPARHAAAKHISVLGVLGLLGRLPSALVLPDRTC